MTNETNFTAALNTIRTNNLNSNDVSLENEKNALIALLFDTMSEGDAEALYAMMNEVSGYREQMVWVVYDQHMNRDRDPENGELVIEGIWKNR